VGNKAGERSTCEKQRDIVENEKEEQLDPREQQNEITD